MVQKYAPDTEVVEIKRNDDDVSATAVRQALKDDNKDEYIKLMPKGTDILYDEFKEQINMVKETGWLCHPVI